MSNIDKAMEIALSCRRCGLPTDAELNTKTATWTTYCECGKTSKYDADIIDEEANEIVKTLPKKK